MKYYSEFYVNEPSLVIQSDDTYCEKCGMTDRYLKNRECQCRNNTEKRIFKGIDDLKYKINLQNNEKIGVTTSGGKDSIYALNMMVDLFGKDHVAALTHLKVGLADEVALKNLYRAVDKLGVELIVVEDSEMINRFKQNLATLIKNPDPALVRVVLCAGCRYGITKELYDVGVKRGIKKYVSAASYLELAPFKEELLCEKCKGNRDVDFDNMIKDYPEYESSLFYMMRDHRYKYKSNNDDEVDLKHKVKEFELFDLDDYMENNPKIIEDCVIRKLGWERKEKSWHFDCIVEDFKDMFYYGILGYTEADFKLSAMVKNGLLSVDEARKQLGVVRYNLSHSYKKMRDLFIEFGLEDSIPYLDDFYRKSPYLYGPNNGGSNNNDDQI